jgi:hypothetical protein
MRSSAKVRVLGLRQYEPIASARSKSGSMRTWSSSGGGRGRAPSALPESVLKLVGSHGRRLRRRTVARRPAMDAYFRNLHELWSSEEPPSPQQERDLMRRHGMNLA